MVNSIGPLEKNIEYGSFGYIKEKEPKIFIKELKNLYLFQFIFSPMNEQDLKFLFKREFSLEKLPFLTDVVSNSKNFSMQTEFDKIWVCSLKKTNSSSFKKFPNLYPLDMSNSKVILNIRGDRSEELLNRLCALDFSKKETSFQTTAMHHISVGIYKKEKDIFTLFIPRSFALSLYQLIFKISLQFGVKVEK